MSNTGAGQALDVSALRQRWTPATQPLDIVIFGAGSIVADAHLPAYHKAGFKVAGVYDPDTAKAAALAEEHDCRVFISVAEAVARDNVVFDLATPPDAHEQILSALPVGAATLIQKPMGVDLDGASRILRVCRDRQLVAAMNFQLRFSPMMLALQDAIDQGMLGEVVDFDAWLALDTPWHLWKFLEGLPRVEIALHSIHYLDLIRAILGDPLGVHAKTLGHPAGQMAQTRTSAILDYGERVRCSLSINHDHAFGRRFQACEFRVCGTSGAAYVKLGVNLDYPRGEPDELWLKCGTDDWQQVPLEGQWFPDAFVARMTQLQRVVCGDEKSLISSVEDGWRTMALVEAAYTSSAAPATPIAPLPEVFEQP